MAGNPGVTPSETGFLDAEDGHRVHWESWGAPDGKPAVVLHGGPGSGMGTWWRELLDLRRYRIVVFDQRGCGRSTPHAGAPAADLATNTTHHLIGDIERLRGRLGIERWLVLGGSWGSTLGLAYAQRHRERITEMVLFSVVTTTRREVAWITRDVGRLFPEAWARFRDGVPEADRDGDLAFAYSRLLNDPDPAVHGPAAREWCAWEQAHVRARDQRYEDAAFRLAFARLVTHYWSHGAWLEEGELLARAGTLSGVPAVLIHGARDVSSPLDIPWALSRAWRGSELIVVEGAGHGRGLAGAVRAATDRFASSIV